eukprot:CAMPEP_0206207296 /NCGR_PEP_ID=MMETSP0166-20121206/15508_1 /ASSEMBLY_ACC=CAM_ASM_000260 /TAXON_ID=95228 /ORGANISM="Vannella robusta, Strain DIVA3 518/3/11/1/6" /LENGTH=318 /DNA_ID=CAMNT_0053628033 /DNA_START=71 /DNA_END=1022 /DNA_ORIENTATION=-
MAKRINDFALGKYFSRVIKAPISKNTEINVPFHPFGISAQSRGKVKELLLKFFPKEDNAERAENEVKCEQANFSPLYLLMTMGLHGFWRFNKAKKSRKEEPKYTLLTFLAEDGTKMMHGDKLRFSKWKFVNGFSSNRGPDPTQEFDGFVENIAQAFKSNRSLKTFEKPIGEVLLNQKYFNGIGNYLRSEILYRANIHPLEIAHNALLVTEPIDSDAKRPFILPPTDEFDFRNSIILKLCNSFCEEMKQASFLGKRVLMKAYNRSNASNFKDNNNRTVWYYKTQQFVIEPENMAEQLANLTPRRPRSRKRKSSVTKEPP